MSYIYLQEQGEESSAECYSDIPASVLSRSRSIPERCCSNGSETESSPASRSGMTCKPSTGDPGGGKSMSCAVDSHAKTCPSQTQKERGSTELEVVYGQKWRESYLKYDRDSRSWKTHRNLWEEDLQESQVTLPTWGMLLDGLLWEVTQPEAARTASGSGCSLMRVIASDGKRQAFRIKSLIRKNHGDGNLSEQLARVHRKKLTPSCGEILMRWPEAWTDLKPLETGKIQSWLQRHSQFFQHNNEGRNAGQ